MPTYDYECGSCRHVFEVFENMTAPGVRDCPKCGKGKARRRIGIGAGLVFKGSGFYKTDSRGPDAGLPEKSIKETDEKFKDTKAKIDSMAEKGDKSYPKASGR